MVKCVEESTSMPANLFHSPLRLHSREVTIAASGVDGACLIAKSQWKPGKDGSGGNVGFLEVIWAFAEDSGLSGISCPNFGDESTVAV